MAVWSKNLLLETVSMPLTYRAEKEDTGRTGLPHRRFQASVCQEKGMTASDK